MSLWQAITRTTRMSIILLISVPRIISFRYPRKISVSITSPEIKALWITSNGKFPSAVHVPTSRGCAKGSASRSAPPTVPVWRRSWRTGTARRSTSGGPRIVLATADGLGTAEIMRRAGKSKPCVRRWQERFMREGVAGLLRDKTRPPRIPPLAQATIDRVVALTRDRAAARGDPLDGAPPWLRRSGSAPARCWGSGARTSSGRTGCGPSSCPRTRSSSPSCATSSGSTSTRRRTRSCSRWTRRRRSRRSTAPSRDCR